MWEYRRVCVDVELTTEQLNRHGSEGWELICFTISFDDSYHYIFGRKKQISNPMLELYGEDKNEK